MIELLVMKEKVKKTYQRYGYIIEPILKFIGAVIVLSMINNTLGYDDRLTRLPVVLVLALISACTPTIVMIIIGAATMIGHIYIASKILAFIVVAIMLILYFLLLRFVPKEMVIVLLLPVLLTIKIPYVVPIVLGLVSGPISIISVACGVVMYYLIQVVKLTTGQQLITGVGIEETLQYYKFVMDTLLSRKEMMLTIIVFALVLLITYVVRKQKIDHAFEIGILSGVVTNILAFLIMTFAFDHSQSIIVMIIGTIVSGGLAYMIQFFRFSLDYTRVEKIQFEDDDYYYYVKAVPKIIVTEPEVNVKRINSRKGNSIQNNIEEHKDNMHFSERKSIE